MLRRNYARRVGEKYKRIPCSQCGGLEYVTLPVDMHGRAMFYEDSGVVWYHDNYPCPSCHPEEWRVTPPRTDTPGHARPAC